MKHPELLYDSVSGSKEPRELGWVVSLVSRVHTDAREEVAALMARLPVSSSSLSDRSSSSSESLSENAEPSVVRGERDWLCGALWTPGIAVLELPWPKLNWLSRRYSSLGAFLAESRRR